MAPKHKSSAAGNSDMPKEACNVYLKWKVESAGLNKQRNTSLAEIAKNYGKRKSIREILKEEKAFIAHETAQVTATKHDRCLVMGFSALCSFRCLLGGGMHPRIGGPLHLFLLWGKSTAAGYPF